MRERRVLRAAVVIWLVQQLVIVTMFVGGFRPSRTTFFAIQAVILTVGLVGATRWYLPPRPK